MYGRTSPVYPSALIHYLEELGRIVAAQIIVRIMFKIASRVKAKHVFGGLAIGTGEAGIGASGTFLYVWNLFIVPPNLSIASHSPLSSAAMIYSMLAYVNLMFLFVSFVSLVLVAYGVVKLSSDSWAAKGFRRFPLVGRFVSKNKRPNKTAKHFPPYIQACQSEPLL